MYFTDLSKKFYTLYNFKYFLDKYVKYILRDNFTYPNPVLVHHTF